MNYAQLAAMVLTKCALYDPYLTDPTEEQARAWAEQLEIHRLDNPDDLKAAVTKVYSEHNAPWRPLPKDITDAARKIRAERAQTALPTPEYQALCDTKAGEHLLNDDGTVAEIDGPPMSAEEAKRRIREQLSRFGRPPAETTGDAASQMRDLAQRQRAAAPPRPLHEPDTTTASAEGHDWQPVTNEDVR